MFYQTYNLPPDIECNKVVTIPYIWDMAILGNLFIIWIDPITPITSLTGNDDLYRPVVCGVSNGFNMDIETITVRNKDDGGWSHDRPGYGSCGFDMDGHALGLKHSDRTQKANFQEMALLCRDKVTFWAKMADMTNSIVREVPVWISSYKETANNNEIYTFNCTFVGVGKPNIITDIYRTYLATNTTGNLLVQDGKDNLIDTKL